jgi:hypothetical protein
MNTHKPSSDLKTAADYLADYQNADFLQWHIRCLLASYAYYLGQPLLPLTASQDPVSAVMQCSYPIASHQHSTEPCFNFANQAALALFKMTPQQMLGLPSKYSAEPLLQEDRERLLAEVNQHGFIQNYAGIRIAADGTRFEIRRATVWNVFDPDALPAQQSSKQTLAPKVIGQAVIIGQVLALTNPQPLSPD